MHHTPAFPGNRKSPGLEVSTAVVVVVNIGERTRDIGAEDNIRAIFFKSIHDDFPYVVGLSIR